MRSTLGSISDLVSAGISNLNELLPTSSAQQRAEARRSLQPPLVEEPPGPTDTAAAETPKVAQDEEAVCLAGGSVSLRSLMTEARAPFGKLLLDRSRLSISLPGSSPGESPALRDDVDPLFASIMRDKLISHMLCCCEAVAKESTLQETRLWNAFVGHDLKLKSLLLAKDACFFKVLEDLGVTTGVPLEAWAFSMEARADREGQIDFADILDWHRNEGADASRTAGLLGRLSTTLFGGEAGAEAGRLGMSRLLPERHAQLRERAASMDLPALLESTAAYQRSMVLTSCWRCEQGLATVFAPLKVRHSASDGVDARPPGPLASLLVVLHTIHLELTPSEQVLWELTGTRDENFDGCFSLDEVRDAMEVLISNSSGGEGGSSDREYAEAVDGGGGVFLELQQLRADCQRQSIDGLFASGGKSTVTLADVLKWWWDMPEEYRVAAGFVMPATLLRRSLQRQPEEMFKGPLRRVAANPAAAEASLRGHVRVFAELRALCARRICESFHGDPSSETGTFASVSEVGSSRSRSYRTSRAQSQEVDEDRGKQACDSPRDSQGSRGSCTPYGTSGRSEPEEEATAAADLPVVNGLLAPPPRLSARGRPDARDSRRHSDRGPRPRRGGSKEVAARDIAAGREAGKEIAGR